MSFITMEHFTTLIKQKNINIITDLEYSWNFLGLSSINVALRDRTHMEKFAVWKKFSFKAAEREIT